MLANLCRVEVEKIRKDTVEQVDRKNRVEAQERAEQKEWVRQQLNESNLEKAAAMERFEERTAELDAKFEITRKVAIEVAEKRAEMEYRIRTMVCFLIPRLAVFFILPSEQ